MKHKIRAVLLSVLLSVIPAFAQSTPNQQASEQFRAAERAEALHYEKSEANRSRADYTEVIRAYERVYQISPHTVWAENALTSIARLYEEMKDPRNAIKTLQLLLHEHPQTPFRELAERDIARLSGASDVNLDVNLKDSASVENVSFSEEDSAIQVVVDVSGNVTFKEGEVPSPDRYFIDITPAQLNPMLTGKQWVVGSKLVQKIRVAQFNATTVRIVLDGPTKRNVTTANLNDLGRIVMNVALPTTRARD